MSSPQKVYGPLPFTALYDPRHFDTAQPAPSLWQATGGPVPVAVDPLRADARVEVAVIGAGIAGLSTALHLAREAGIEVRVLEAGSVGWGASGRAAGFCTLGGSRLGWGALARRFGIEEARRSFVLQRHAVALVAELARLHRIDLKRSGEGEYVVAHRPGRMRELAEERALVRDRFGEDWPLLSRAELRARGIALEEAYGALFIPHAFGIHPLRYVRGLARAATEHGVRIHERSPVVAWERQQGWHRLITPGGSLWARRVVVAATGYLPERLWPSLEGRVLPALSCVLATRPLTASEREAQGWTEPALVADTRRLLFYMRLLGDGRVLFGARGGLSTSPTAFEERRRWLEARFRERFPAWRHVGIEFAWWGLVALARDGFAHLAEPADPPGVTLIGPFHGSGLAMATALGRLAALRLAGRREDPPPPAFLSRPLPAFPLPRLRLAYLALAYLGYGLRDRWL